MMCLDNLLLVINAVIMKKDVDNSSRQELTKVPADDPVDYNVFPHETITNPLKRKE
jgi:hypothetical protein